MASPTYPLATLAAQITPAGITAPSYNDILNSLIASYQSIYGSDVLLTPDTQDYQLLAVFALAISDSNNTVIAVYNGFRPSYAQFAALSSLVKINGIARQASSNSTADILIVGVVGTNIYNGIVADELGNLWDLPALVTIPLAGEITVTAVCETKGEINAPANTITGIFTRVIGWQTATNSAEATPGSPVETDSALRLRQTKSTALPSLTLLQSILAGVAACPGVTRYKIYENNTSVTDGNGTPGHSIALVVEGGSDADIATAIERRKAPGIGTHGTTTVTVEDPAGLPIEISFFRLDNVNIYASITLQALPGYVSSTGVAAAQALVDFINAQDIGEELYYNWALAAASLINNPLFVTFRITAFTIGLSSGSLGTSDIPVLYNQATASDISKVTVIVV